MEWKDVSLSKFEELRGIRPSGDEVTDTVSALCVLEGRDEDYFLDMTVDELGRHAAGLKFMERLPVPGKVRDRYVLNGTRYDLQTDPRKMTAAQYIDFQTFIREPDANLRNIAAVFLIPHSAEAYGKGYDLQDAVRDAGALNVEDAYGISFFFAASFAALGRGLLFSGIRTMRKEMRRMARRGDTERLKKIQRELLHSLG